MSAKGLSDEDALAALALYRAHGEVYARAAASIDMPRGTFENRVHRGLIVERNRLAEGDKPIEAPPALRGEVDVLRERVFELERQIKESRANTLDEKYVRSKIIGITEAMESVTPPPWTLLPPDSGQGLPGVPTLFMSDWHAGEVVYRGQLNGVNEFNMEIMRTRVRRLVERAVHLLTEYVVNPKYPGIVAPLGGDVLSGDIHDELTESNEAPTLVVLLEMVEVLIWVLTTLADKFGHVFVPGVAGNHGRNTKKPRAKNRAFTNFDWLLLQFLRRALASDDRITFFIPDGSDAWYRIFQHRYLLTHGDQFRGGDGIIGAIGPIQRGNQKKQARNAAIDMGYDTMILGHWHQYIPKMDTIVNGSLKGYDEFASQYNFAFQVPIQAMWMTHPRYGITQHWPIYLEEPNRVTEGMVTHDWISWKDAA